MDKPIRRTVGICVGHSLKTRPMEFYSPCEVEPYITYLEQRAEAAEAALEVEKDIHDDTMQAMHLWVERAKEAEAKLAERAKQEPDYFLNRIESSDKWGSETELRIYESQLDASKSKDDHGGRIIELFTRPAPAAPVKLPPKSDVKMGGDVKTRSLLTGMNMMRKSCAEAIRAAGYEVDE